MTPIVTATDAEWDRLLASDRPVFVDFWAPWCGWCRRLAPSFARLASEFGDRATFATVNVDDEPDLAARYGIQGIPALKFFVGGVLADEIAGFVPEAALRARLERVLAAAPAIA